MKIRFNDETYNVNVLQDNGNESLIEYPSGEKEWTPNVDLKRYAITQKNFEEKVKIEPEKKKERQQQRREKTLKGKGIGLEIHR